MAQVRAKLGDSPVIRCSHEEEANNEVCYVSTLPDHTKVSFISGIVTGWDILDGVKIVAGQIDAPCYRECSASPLVTSKIQTEGGLRLGLSKRQVYNLLGAPTKGNGDEMVFEWESKVPKPKKEMEKGRPSPLSPPEPYWHAVDTIEVRFSNSRVVMFEVHFIRTD